MDTCQEFEFLLVIKGSIQVQLKDLISGAPSANPLDTDRLSEQTTFRSKQDSRLQSFRDAAEHESKANQTALDKILVIKSGSFIDKRLFKAANQQSDANSQIKSSWSELLTHFQNRKVVKIVAN